MYTHYMYMSHIHLLHVDAELGASDLRGEPLRVGVEGPPTTTTTTTATATATATATTATTATTTATTATTATTTDYLFVVLRKSYFHS